MTDQKNKAFKRKKLNLAVKRDLQMWLLARIIGLIAVCTVVAVGILYFYSRQEVASSFYSAHIQLRRVSDLLLPVIASGAVVSLLGGVILALFLPQKLAGPIYRIQRGLQTIGEGDLTEHVSLRKNDILKDVAASVNETTGNLRVKIEEIKAIHQELEKTIAELEHEKAAALIARQHVVLAHLRTEKQDSKK